MSIVISKVASLHGNGLMCDRSRCCCIIDDNINFMYKHCTKEVARITDTLGGVVFDFINNLSEIIITPEIRIVSDRIYVTFKHIYALSSPIHMNFTILQIEFYLLNNVPRVLYYFYNHKKDITKFVTNIEYIQKTEPLDELYKLTNYFPFDGILYTKLNEPFHGLLKKRNTALIKYLTECVDATGRFEDVDSNLNTIFLLRDINLIRIAITLAYHFAEENIPIPEITFDENSPWRFYYIWYVKTRTEDKTSFKSRLTMTMEYKQDGNCEWGFIGDVKGEHKSVSFHHKPKDKLPEIFYDIIKNFKPSDEDFCIEEK